MFSAPVALQAGLSNTAVHLDTCFCLHVSLCVFVVAEGRLNVWTRKSFYTCVLQTENVPNKKNSRD